MNFSNKNKTNEIWYEKKLTNLYLTGSMDWEVKLWKPNFTNFVSIAKHEDFITSLDINNNLNPFIFASADAEGSL